MESSRRHSRAVLPIQLAAFLFLSACSKSVTVEREEALDQRVVRTSENVIAVNRGLCEHQLTVDAAMVEGVTPPDFGIVLGISGSVWVRPQNLTVTVDGDVWRSSESTTTEFGGACPEQSSVQAKFGVAAQGACVFRESYWYPVSVELLRRLGHAGQVTVRVDGLAGYVEREFSPENLSRFREFVAAQVPADDSLPLQPGN